MIGCYLVVISFPVGCGQSYCPTCFCSNTLSPHPLHRESLQHSSTGNILHAPCLRVYRMRRKRVYVCGCLQVKMVSNMKEAFGNMLLTDYIDDNPDRSSLPSPEVKNSHKRCLEFTPTGCHYQLSF